MVLLTLQIFEKGWRCRNRRCSPWQRFRGSFGQLCLRARTLLICSSFFLKIVEFTTLSLIITQFILLLFYLSYKGKTRSSPTPCDFRFPSCPRHGDVLEPSLLAGRQSCELSPAPETEMRETHGGGHETQQEEMQCVWGLCVWLGLLKPRHSGCS